MAGRGLVLAAADKLDIMVILQTLCGPQAFTAQLGLVAICGDALGRDGVGTAQLLLKS